MWEVQPQRQQPFLNTEQALRPERQQQHKRQQGGQQGSSACLTAREMKAVETELQRSSIERESTRRRRNRCALQAAA